MCCSLAALYLMLLRVAYHHSFFDLTASRLLKVKRPHAIIRRLQPAEAPAARRQVRAGSGGFTTSIEGSVAGKRLVRRAASSLAAVRSGSHRELRDVLHVRLHLQYEEHHFRGGQQGSNHQARRSDSTAYGVAPARRTVAAYCLLGPQRIVAI